jgi:hypothetical protein
LSTHFSTLARIHSHFGSAPQSAASVVPTSAVAGETPRRRQAIAAEKDIDTTEHKPSRAVIAGAKFGVLNNNEVNLTMAVMTTLGAMVWWGGFAEVVRVFNELAGRNRL